MHLFIAINLKCYYMVPLIAINSINRSLLETMRRENNSLAGAYSNEKGEVGMAAGCGMLIRGQWDGPVISEIAMKWDEMWSEICFFCYY